MSNLRPGRVENRRSVFYTSNHNSSSEEWEMLDAPPKDFPEQKTHLDTQRRESTLAHPRLLGDEFCSSIPFCICSSSCSDSFGSAFTFDFGRNRHRPQRLLLRDVWGPGKFGRGVERRGSGSPTGECNGSKSLEMQLRLQNQQDEMNQMQQEQNKLREELASQKVSLFFFVLFYQTL